MATFPLTFPVTFGPEAPSYEVGQYVVGVPGVNGEIIAIGCHEIEEAVGDYVLPVMTSDGSTIPLKVKEATEVGDKGVPVATTTSEMVLASMDQGDEGERGVIDLLPFAKFIGRPNTVSIIDNPGEVLFDFDGTGALGDLQTAFTGLYYQDVDGNGDSVPISIDQINRVASVPGVRYNIEHYFTAARLQMRMHLITTKFNPSTVTWGTQPIYALVKRWRVPLASSAYSIGTAGTYGVLEGDDLLLSAVAVTSGDIYGVRFEFFVEGGFVNPGSFCTLKKPLTPAQIIGWD